MFWHQTFRLVLDWRGSERSILRRKVASRRSDHAVDKLRKALATFRALRDTELEAYPLKNIGLLYALYEPGAPWGSA
jgi:hypothetical protein